MELTELKNKIHKAFKGSAAELQRIVATIESDASAFPFNEYEHLICTLIDKKKLTYKSYLEIRTEYVAANPNLYLFEISAPRGFGEKFAQTYICGMCSGLLRPSKNLDKKYSGEYDLWLDGIKIEVKSSRAVDAGSDEPLYIKALSSNTKKSFSMNFQQLKPQFCDVFIWLAVFRDEIVLWVMNSDEVKTNSFFSSGQHRGNKGNEGQLHINNENIGTMNKYKLRGDNLEKAIRNAFRRKKKSASGATKL